MAKQVIYRRGTTAEHATFTGANGEITVDTVKHVVIVHDGVTPGGWPVANTSSITSSINTLTANAANQAASIIALTANAATQSNAIAALQGNISTELLSNVTVIFANIADVRANVLAAHANVELLWGNATVQSEAIANITPRITPGIIQINANAGAYSIPTTVSTVLLLGPLDSTNANLFLPDSPANGQTISISPMIPQVHYGLGVGVGAVFITSNVSPILYPNGSPRISWNTIIISYNTPTKLVYYNSHWWPLGTA